MHTRILPLKPLLSATGLAKTRCKIIRIKEAKDEDLLLHIFFVPPALNTDPSKRHSCIYQEAIF